MCFTSLTEQFAETAGRMWIKKNIFTIVALLCVLVQYNVTYAKRILFIASLPSYSHQITYRGISLELNKRGHEIVLVTTDPIKNSSLVNYTEIDLHYLYGTSIFKALPYKDVTQASMNLPFLGVEQLIWKLGTNINREVFNNPEMKKLYAANSNEHFDAVIVAQGISPSMNAFAYRFKAPLIGISSLDVFNQIRYTLGGAILPSHNSNWQTNRNWQIENMSFWERLVNFYEVWMQIYNWINVHIPGENALVKKYLGDNIPSVLDIMKNMSVYLVSKHPMISIPRQEQLNIKYFHGLHIAPVQPPLSQEIKRLLDKASNGFIYVSLGTNVNWNFLPKNLLKIFIETLASLPWQILWKSNPNLILKKYENIIVSKWFPQQSILAHPNIKLFIYQGGLQSTEEAIYHKVPLIGIPIIWDQKYQVQNIKKLGIGMYLNYKNLSKETFVTAIHEVINNKRYKEQIKEVNKLYKDIPYDTLQNAIWWIEHTMRYNGVIRLEDRICDEPWYRRYDWDIISFLAIAAFTTFLISLYVLFQILRFICKRYRILCKDSQYYVKSKSQ